MLVWKKPAWRVEERAENGRGSEWSAVQKRVQACGSDKRTKLRGAIYRRSKEKVNKESEKLKKGS